MKIAFALLLPASALALAPPSPSYDQSSTAKVVGRRQFLTSTLLAPIAGAVLVSSNPSSSNAFDVGGRMVVGDESIMTQKGHGTSAQPVQEDLLYGVDVKLADRICNYNRHFAEQGGFFRSTNWEDVLMQSEGPLTFYDSVTGKPLFVAPIGRSKEDLITESRVHGWPSFRDNEAIWENVRVLRNSGETVSTDGTHLGHNLPDRRGNRYCINLVSIAGKPTNNA
mmetsp:Transcript_7619/g.9968  ORF Transcript_7619/g.9968 Transcript_7619/m.9968 type:complete len:224 (+) Transcript_7619:130-801(+)|eukprot:CAMPEP_0198144456 /NCGR_PEP_ID=MMETSP1443-20131203/15997_1 /TAXON_ID=186043 /ORGANISM="Entomoneis sp., Strain CCMP2396" /LENGTH=223 /DNA_ID=CAMNT_0043807857 /DNA_START=67 /DNA_END=738 /DNA_ORIENTATION=-